MFSFFETSYEPGFLAASKVLANGVPRTAITRTSDERKEVIFNEVTQGSTLFLALPVTSVIGNYAQSAFSGISPKMLAMANADAFQQTSGKVLRQLKTAKLGKSLGASLMIASLLISTTYLRNYRTIKRTGFSDYKDVVGLGGPRTSTEQDKIKAEAAMKKNLNIIKGLLIGGAATGLTTMAVFGAIARKDGKMLSRTGVLNPKRLNKLFDRWAFVGKRSNQINGPFKPSQTMFGNQGLWVWGIPSYLGWFLGCRDKYEVAEQSSKFATFWAGYMATPRLIGKWMAKKHKALFAEAEKFGGTGTYTKIKTQIADKAPELAKRLEKQKTNQWLWLMGVNILVAGALPIVFNIMFNKWRYAREQNEKTVQAPNNPALQAQQQLYGSLLNRKTFKEFAHTTPTLATKPLSVVS